MIALLSKALLTLPLVFAAALAHVGAYLLRFDFTIPANAQGVRSMWTQLKWKHIAPRMLVDFAIIHIAMLIAFTISLIYQTNRTDVSLGILANSFQSYYISTFLFLSLSFPAVFFVNGFYTYVRSYVVKAKLRRFATVAGLALAVFITLNMLVIGSAHPVGRSVALPFAVCAICGLIGVRLGKEWVLSKESAERFLEGPRDPKTGGIVLVVGGAGYIGSWLVRRLLERGCKVRVMDNAVYGLEPIQDLIGHQNLEYLNGDCRNIHDVVKAIRGTSAVVHLAAIVGDPACELDHTAAVEINYAATRMMMEVAKGHGVERFLFASSCSVYGATDELMDENSNVEPISLYGQTKLSSEQALLEGASEEFHPVILRFATVFGLSTRPRFDLVVNLLSAKAHQDGLITIFNGEQWRPFVHVKDLAEAMLLVLEAPLPAVSGQIFNVGDNRLNHTLSELACVIQRVFPGTRVEEVENSDRRNYRVNFDKIGKRIGFRCHYTLEDGIREIKSAFDNHQIADYKDTKFSNAVFLRKAGSPEHKTEIDAGVMAAFGGEHLRRAAAHHTLLSAQA
jgi:nucleoside-diphosphate-sugar epimerase